MQEAHLVLPWTFEQGLQMFVNLPVQCSVLEQILLQYFGKPVRIKPALQARQRPVHLEQVRQFFFREEQALPELNLISVKKSVSRVIFLQYLFISLNANLYPGRQVLHTPLLSWHSLHPSLSLTDEQGLHSFG